MSAPVLRVVPRADLEEEASLLRLAAIGAVDDGKSTLIGRLLHDSGQLTDDQLEAIRRASEARGQDVINLSFATDGLKAEREQGITIDVAYRYAVTRRRKLVIADCPGHLEYTANMATGASTADLALAVVDATRGLRQQTRRHLAIALLFGVKQVVVAVNKMDLVGWERGPYERAVDQMRSLVERLGGAELVAVPVSALEGDNVVEPSARCPWHPGPTLLDALEAARTTTFAAQGPGGPRLAVQGVVAGPSGSPRLSGMLTGAGLSLGDEVVLLPQGERGRVAQLETPEGGVGYARAPLSVTVELDRPLGARRGDMLAADEPPTPTRDLVTTVFWFGSTPLTRGRRFLVKHTTRLTGIEAEEVRSRLDLAELRLVPASRLSGNEIGVVRWRSDEPLAADRYSESRATGSAIVIDPETHLTLAALMVGRPSLA